MDFLRLIFKNATRNRRRSALTLLSVAMSLFLLVSLRTFLSELEFSRTMLKPEAVLRLVTRHAVSLNIPLPLSYRQRIEQVPGVELVDLFQPFGGYYQDPKNFLFLAASDPEMVDRIASELKFNPEELASFRQDRTGALVGRNLMERFGWKVGDRITIVGMLLPFGIELVIQGSYTGPDEGVLIFRYDYFNELLKKHLPGAGDKVGTFWIKVRSVEDVPRVAAAIDEMFRNSDAPTKTETEKAWALSFTSMLGNIRLFLMLIATAVVFAILLVTMNTMAMSVRERTGEIAVLKTLGFRRWQVLTLLVGESVLIALTGGAMGVLGAKIVFSGLDIYQLTSGIIQHFQISPLTIAAGLAVAALVGAISAMVPAWGAVNASVGNALRQVG